MNAPEGVEIEAKDETGSWETVCTTPCDKPLPSSGYYRINGSGIRASAPFRIHPGSAVRLEVQTTSSAAHAASIVIVVIGGAGLVPAAGVTAAWLGAVFFGLILICPLVDAFSSTSYGGCLGDISSAVGQYYLRPYVWIPAIAGIGMVAGGGALLAATPPSKVTPFRSNAAARTPTWREAPIVDALGARPAMPILRLSF